MARAKLDPEILAHLEWIGFVRPTGLVVSAPALVRAGAILDRRDAEGQSLLRGCIEQSTFDPKEGSVPHLPDFRKFAESVLGWSFSPMGYAGTSECPIPPELEVPLPDYGETLRPDFAVRELEPKDGGSPWQLLVNVLEPGQDFDRVAHGHGRLDASAHGRMERLLRQTGVPAGLLFNGRALRLLSAPRGESSGWLDFRVADMAQTAGRPISTALRLLLGQVRLLSLPRVQRLATLLDDSRKFQNEVSERLAEQVLHALYELLRGFQAAHDASKGELLREPLAEHPDQVYRALLTVILRLVFLLFAEERDMLPEDEIFLRHYSLAGLYERLREDAALFPDTMDQRFGAWAQLLVLFRMIHDGAESGAMHLPRRHGVLFDPDRFKFLEGRSGSGVRQIDERIDPPLVPDGTIYRALEDLLVLDGERISYRALDVEQIGSVYETMMGFRLETATGRSVAIKAQKKQGAPTAVSLEELCAEPAGKRAKWIQDRADRRITDTIQKAVTVAATVEDLHAALLPVIDLAATPDLVPTGAMLLQPSEERRRSGSHYTPRALTEPIVRTTLEPILARLRGADGQSPRPEQILDLKVCDPAMGSGAFLVEACRQLGDALVESWRAHGEVPAIPPDEDEVIYARRLIAQRCLYGVDRNPVAVDLAKVSLWLVTLAKDHSLTFVDHALRQGDSLVGLSSTQIEAFHWAVTGAVLKGLGVREPLERVSDLRRRIRDADESVSDRERRDLWDKAQLELANVRLHADLLLAAYFEAEKPRDRERKRSEYMNVVLRGEAERYRGWLEERRYSDPPLAPFHWEIEFPEVFDRANGGFDSIIGNPPFVGGKMIAIVVSDAFRDWLKEAICGRKGAADLVAYFFHRAVSLLANERALGFVATKTVLQGDTREVGLSELIAGGYKIFDAQSPRPWPGQAGVHFVRVHMWKGGESPLPRLDGKLVPEINSWLKAAHEFGAPSKLLQQLRASSGTMLLGDGFVLTPAELAELEARDPKSRVVIRPFMNGDDFVNRPDLSASRFAIDFGVMNIDEARRYEGAFDRIERLVRPNRDRLTRQIHEKCFWKHWDKRPQLYEDLRQLRRTLACARVSKHIVFDFVDLADNKIFSEKVQVFPTEDLAVFAVLQSQVHALWVERFTSTRGTTFNYSISDCFLTFPFPSLLVELRAAGERLLASRHAIMLRRDEGLTSLYNRFNDADDTSGSETLKLRELHAAMDRAVLGAYGWSDIPTECKFLLDYEIDEEEWGTKKKPWRYRWPDEVRDEVLARLLELNAERAKEETRTGAVAAKPRRRKKAGRRTRKESGTGDLFS